MADFPSVTLFSRVASYPAVQKFYSSAKVYYNTAKETSPYVKYGLETAETKLTEIAEASKPVLKKLEEPQYQRYIHDADSFGCRQLDFIETRVSNAKHALDAISAKKEELLKSQPVTTVKNALDTHVLQPVVPAFQETAKLVNNTVNTYLTTTENFVDRVLPETQSSTSTSPSTSTESKKEQTVQNEETTTTNNNVYTRVYNLGSKVSHRVGSQVLTKLHNFNWPEPKTVEQVKNQAYVNLNHAYVNLIEYSKQLDSFLPPSVKLNTLSEKVTPVKKQADEYAKAVASRVTDYVNTLEKNPLASPYVNYLKQIYPQDGHFHFKLPKVTLNDFKNYVAEVRSQVLASPVSYFVLENLKNGAAYTIHYVHVLEENPNFAHSIQLAKNYALTFKDKALNFLQNARKQSSVVIEEIQDEVSQTVKQVEAQVEKKVEQIEKKAVVEPAAKEAVAEAEVIEQNGNHEGVELQQEEEEEEKEEQEEEEENNEEAN